MIADQKIAATELFERVVDENLREATRWFERAIEADENFARPRAMWV